jgi:hypothetical protein
MKAGTKRSILTDLDLSHSEGKSPHSEPSKPHRTITSLTCTIAPDQNGKQMQTLVLHAKLRNNAHMDKPPFRLISNTNAYGQKTINYIIFVSWRFGLGVRIVLSSDQSAIFFFQRTMGESSADS